MGEQSDTPDRARLRAAATDAISGLWWYTLLRGVLLVGLGIYMLVRPGMSAVAFAQVLGILLLLEGALALGAGILGRTASRGLTIGRGIVLLLLGILIVAQPVLVAGIAITTVLYLVAFAAIVGGVLDIVAAIRERKEIEGEGWLVLRGLFAATFGVLLLIAPIAFGLVIVRVIGVLTLLIGIALVVLAFKFRTLRNTLQEGPSP